MMAIRRPARVKLPESAYKVPTTPLVPDTLADLERVPGRCYSPAVVVQCHSPGPGFICADCALLELGEGWADLKIRTNAGIPRGKYYREQARADAAREAR